MSSSRWTHLVALRNDLWYSAGISLFATLLVFVVSHGTSFSDLDFWSYDFTTLHAGLVPPSKDVLFVDFDEDTFQRIGQYPIPRSIVAQAIEKIGEQKPKVIGVDIFLSEPRTPAEDKQMQAALTSAQVVILARQNSSGLLPAVRPMEMFCQPEDPADSTGFCKEGTPGALGFAAINLSRDQDGFVRRANLLSGADKPSPGFALALAQQYTGQTMTAMNRKYAVFLGHKIYFADQDTQTFYIGSWGRHPATVIPVWKLLSGQVPADTMKDKLVVLGQTNDSARDTHFTPLFRRAEADGERIAIGGTEIHAAAIRSLLEGTAVRPAADWVAWIRTLGWCWLAAFFLLHMRTGVGAIFAAMLFVVPILVSLGLYHYWRVWAPYLYAEIGVASTFPITLGLQYVMEKLVAREAHAQRKQMMSLFSSYVDPAVASTIWERRNELSLAGEERTATVMFTDIRSFTAKSAGQPPAQVLGWLNEYMSAMDEVIRAHDGFLNKFIGDGLMIIFGLPLSKGIKEDAKRAVDAAMAMLDRVELLNKQNIDNPTHPQLRIGVGIHTGSLMAGSIGSASRQEYSVIGATVNLASRLESLNKPYKTEIIMSDATYEILRDQYTGFRALGPAKVAGLEDPVDIFTITQESPIMSPKVA